MYRPGRDHLAGDHRVAGGDERVLLDHAEAVVASAAEDRLDGDDLLLLQRAIVRGDGLGAARDAGVDELV